MSGYFGYSMSNNALDAYEDGLMPLSKWTKTAILCACAEYLEGEADASEKIGWLSKCRLATLKKHILDSSEWHHTSSHYNVTRFFGVDEYVLDDLTAEQVEEWRAEKAEPEKPAEPTRRMGSIDYIVWGGTRRHPKAFERRMENVEIEEKGCFYHVYAEGKLVLRKKIGSNGTFVKYNA